MTHRPPTERTVQSATDGALDFERRTVLRAAGALAAIAGVGSTSAAAAPWGGDADIDPIFGYASEGPIPEEFPSRLEPDHVVEAHIDFEDGYGFHFDPVGLHVQPGDVVMFEMHSPDHTVTAYHPGFGRQRRVPAGVGPFSSPVLPFMPAGQPDDEDDDDVMTFEYQGYWLYQFVAPGIYDYLCAPHEILGMVGRIIVHAEGQPVPEESFPEAGRPPEPVNLLNNEDLLAEVGLPPWPLTMPSAAEVLDDDMLDVLAIVDAGEVGWHDLVDAFNA